MTISRLLVIGAVLVLALSGCTPTSAPPSPTSATRTATPTPTPSVSADPVAERLVFDSEGIRTIDASGEVIASFDYFQPVGDIVPSLSALFGAEPAVEDVQPYEGPRYTNYDWHGFTLRDIDQETVDPYYPDFRAEASAASLNGIVIETVDGISVGDDSVPIEAAHPESVRHYGPSDSGEERFTIDVGTRQLPDYVDEYGTHAASLWVGLWGPVGGTVETINAPFGGGPGI